MVQQINLGSKVPDFTLKDESGTDVTLYKALEDSQRGVVLFVYPKANTPGCTVQACGFRDVYDVLKAKGYQVFGLSKDKQTAQAAWKAKHTLPYSLLCEGHNVLEMFGCLNGTSTIRSVFIVAKEDAVLCFQRIKISPADSTAAVLAFTHDHAATSTPTALAGAESAPSGRSGRRKLTITSPTDIPQRKSPRLVQQANGKTASITNGVSRRPLNAEVSSANRPTTSNVKSARHSGANSKTRLFTASSKTNKAPARSSSSLPKRPAARGTAKGKPRTASDHQGIDPVSQKTEGIFSTNVKVDGTGVSAAPIAAVAASKVAIPPRRVTRKSARVKTLGSVSGRARPSRRESK